MRSESAGSMAPVRVVKELQKDPPTEAWSMAIDPPPASRLQSQRASTKQESLPLPEAAEAEPVLLAAAQKHTDSTLVALLEGLQRMVRESVQVCSPPLVRLSPRLHMRCRSAHAAPLCTCGAALHICT